MDQQWAAARCQVVESVGPAVFQRGRTGVSFLAIMTIDATVTLPSTTPRSLAVVNARLWTGDARRPWADALLTDGPRLAAVGSSAEIIKRRRAQTEIIDARGQ